MFMEETPMMYHEYRDKAPRRSMAFGFVGLGLLLGTQTVAAQAVSEIQNAKPGDWPSYHRTYDSQQYSPLDRIRAM
jgi:hypothetical protein